MRAGARRAVKGRTVARSWSLAASPAGMAEEVIGRMIMVKAGMVTALDMVTATAMEAKTPEALGSEGRCGFLRSSSNSTTRK
jgi:hypothetical protein